jgi:hypothetical protein
MSLHVAAKHLASKGRNGDSTLVHMSPGEVKGLQALAMAHGGSLSINPDTGLVEASFLKRILPMVAGAALMATGVGAPMAAGLVGGFETLRTGDINKGLMAGLGAYGGAGLASGLTGAAGSAAVDASAANALGVPASVGGAAAGPGSQAAMLAAENASMGLTPMQSAAQISGSAGYAAGAAPASTGLQASNLMTSGVRNLMANPMEAGKDVYKAMPTGTLPALGITAASAMTPEAPAIPGMPEEDPMYAGAPYRYKLASNFTGYVPRQPTPYYRPTGLGYAEGGDVMVADGGSYDDEPMGDVGMAAGGSLGSYSDGGRMLKGPGDGMSDDIPAMIGKKQPARLADGEFVVPADVVSHLGNGSTDAGAKKLYGMMDQIRKARTGTKKQGKQIKADKFLPKFADGGSVATAAPAAVSAPATAPASAPAFSYPGSGMSLADITSLGNFIARGNAAPMQAATPAPMPAPTQAPTQAPMFTDMGLSAKLAAAQSNRPVAIPTPVSKASEYANLRPDMLIDPASAGWTKAEYVGSSGFLGRNRGTLNVPEGAQTYTDPNGSIWFRA